MLRMLGLVETPVLVDPRFAAVSSMLAHPMDAAVFLVALVDLAVNYESCHEEVVLGGDEIVTPPTWAGVIDAIADEMSLAEQKEVSETLRGIASQLTKGQ